MKILLIISLLISAVFACQLQNAGSPNAYCAGPCDSGYLCSFGNTNACKCFRNGIGRRELNNYFISKIHLKSNKE
jgi:hypothetical protein